MWLPIFCCAFSALGSFLFGYDSGIISSSIAQHDFVHRFGQDSALPDSTAGGIVSSFTGGAMLGSLLVSPLADRYGRKAAIFLGSVMACLGGTLQGGASNVATIIVSASESPFHSDAETPTSGLIRNKGESIRIGVSTNFVAPLGDGRPPPSHVL